MFNTPASILDRYCGQLKLAAYAACDRARMDPEVSFIDDAPYVIRAWAAYDAACVARKTAARTGRFPRGYGWVRAQQAAEQRDAARIEAKFRMSPPTYVSACQAAS